MDIIIQVLKELLFTYKEVFWVECDIDNRKNIVVNVKVMISEENASQVFLLIECDNSQLADYVDGEIIKEIAVKFRRNEYHRAEMDRNTTLILVCKNVKDTIDLSSKIKIEDDPYYFKKYVFSYDEAGAESAKIWLEENIKRGSVISLIQEYISDTGRFARYKEKNQKEVTYTFFMELVTKVHCFPMKAGNTKNIRSVNEFLYDEIKALRNKNRKPINIDLEIMKSFVESDIDFDSVDEVCSKWNSLHLKESEEG